MAQLNALSFTKHDKLSSAPSAEHEFPDGNITLAEIAAFLPQSIKCWDIIDRIIWNGATTSDIKVLINKYRDIPDGGIANNTVYRMMRGQTDKRATEDADYKGWTVSTYKNIEKPEDFDSSSISVTGFRRPIIFKNRPDRPAAAVPFKDLAQGVARMPQSEDALDLTRCVTYCVANPEEEWYYPTDFQQLLNDHLEGPMPLKPDHEDAQVLKRLRSHLRHTTRRRPSMNMKTRTEDDDDDGDTSLNLTQTKLGKRNRSTSRSDKQRNRVQTQQNLSTKVPDKTQVLSGRPRCTAPLKHHTSNLTIDSEDDTDDDAYQGPKRMKKTNAAPRRSERETKKASYAMDDTSADEDDGVDLTGNNEDERYEDIDDGDEQDVIMEDVHEGDDEY
ncbi:hypothetical protein N0V94_002818 [Neodidymelliopsis sp. IMI 364377]|nr:hypothetical protein N0V94_002818 [Neodidymelliopsis sp. IMI 364377]